MIHLAQSADGRLVLASNQAMPSDISRIEYYRDQKLFQFIFEDTEAEDQLMPAEMSDEVAEIIKKSPDIIVVAMAEEGEEPYGYVAPLVQIGL